MERFFGSLKSEWTDARVNTTREAARLDVVEYIEMQYNSVRPPYHTGQPLAPGMREGCCLGWVSVFI